MDGDDTAAAAHQPGRTDPREHVGRDRRHENAVQLPSCLSSLTQLTSLTVRSRGKFGAGLPWHPATPRNPDGVPRSLQVRVLLIRNYPHRCV